MVSFSSDRERRLWWAVLLVMVAIYTTLGLARSLAGALRAQGVLEASFALAMVLVAAVIVAHGIRARSRAAEWAVGLGIAAVYLLIFVRMATPEERTHLIEYGVVGVLVHEALAERARHGLIGPRFVWLAIPLTAALGLVDEGIQAFLPSRVFDPRDLLFNLLAGSMAVVAVRTLRWVRERRNA